jgi:hypothetical protein
MQEFARVQSVLRATHAEIPLALQAERDLGQQLGASEARGTDTTALRQQLTEAKGSRERALLKRAAAMDEAVNLEVQIRSERMRLERSRPEKIKAWAEAANGRYAAAYREFQRAWAECELVKTLGGQVYTPVPFHERFDFNGVPRMEHVPDAAVKAEMDPEFRRFDESLKRLDEALVTIAAIKRSREADSRYFALAIQRRQPIRVPGVYRLLEKYFCPIAAMDLPAGALVDAELLGHDVLDRLIRSVRKVQPVEMESPASTAA